MVSKRQLILQNVDCKIIRIVVVLSNFVFLTELLLTDFFKSSLSLLQQITTHPLFL